MPAEPEQNEANLLHTYLAQRDEPCPLCHYNLRDLQGDNCPECGQALVLRVNLVDAVRGAYLAGLIGLACAFGFNALFFILVLGLTFLLSGGPDAYFIMYQFASVIVTGGLLSMWIGRSSRLHQLTRKRRVLLTIAAWFVVIASLMIPGIMIILDTW